jgi:hypothetical protein
MTRDSIDFDEATLQTLATHPDRSTLLSDRLDMTVAEARKIMRAYKLATTVPKTSAQKLTASRRLGSNLMRRLIL